MNKILLGYTAIGPTYKDRVIYHIKKYENQYKYFDVLILTNDPDYYKFEEIKYKSNVIIEDLNIHRNQYPEFLEHEIFPEEKISDSEYKKEILNLVIKGHRFPLHLQRFILNYKNIDKYKGIIMLDCDVAPIINNDIEFLNFSNYLDKMENDSVSSNKCYYTWENRPRVIDFIIECKKDLNIETIKDLKEVSGFDNPLKLLKFKSPEKLANFFKLWNYCLLKSFNSDLRNYLIPIAWGDASEIIISILYTLENIKVNKENIDYDTLNYFKSYTYPEDRFWNDVTHLDFNISANSKKEFIELNYSKLKKFYEDCGQEFPY